MSKDAKMEFTMNYQSYKNTMDEYSKEINSLITDIRIITTPEKELELNEKLKKYAELLNDYHQHILNNIEIFNDIIFIPIWKDILMKLHKYKGQQISYINLIFKNDYFYDKLVFLCELEDVKLYIESLEK